MKEKKETVHGLAFLNGYDEYLENIATDLKKLRRFLAKNMGSTDDRLDHESFRNWETTLFENINALTELIEEIRKEQGEKGA